MTHSNAKASTGAEFNLQTAKQVYYEHELERSRIRALILDDFIKFRRGKKIEAVSRHFDHVSNTYVLGQQVLTLGLATEDAFLPLDSQMYVSGSQPGPLIKPYKGGRSSGAKRYQEAIGQSKVEVAVGMLRRAVRAGIRADYVAADAWFGNKEMMRAGLSLDIMAILRMKKNKLKYRVENDGPITWKHTAPTGFTLLRFAIVATLSRHSRRHLEVAWPPTGLHS